MAAAPRPVSSLLGPYEDSFEADIADVLVTGDREPHVEYGAQAGDGLAADEDPRLRRLKPACPSVDVKNPRERVVPVYR